MALHPFLKRVGLGVLTAGLLASPIWPQAKANEWNERTVMTFNQPVEIPGRVLEPGTYVFQLANSNSDRDIVQVFNEDQTRILATEMTIPVERLTPRGHTVVTFEERAQGSPEAIHNWFYPGDLTGHQFLYHHRS